MEKLLSENNYKAHLGLFPMSAKRAMAQGAKGRDRSTILKEIQIGGDTRDEYYSMGGFWRPSRIFS